MQSAPKHKNEAQRIEELLRFDVLDSEDELAFDELTELASSICATPISLITLIDQERQWFKSRVGLEMQETPRDHAFCSHAILHSGVFEVPDTEQDSRFIDNPLVTGQPHIRFYAGAPLVTQSGLPIGTLCVIDKVTRELTDKQKRALQLLAHQVMGQLQLRLNYKMMQRVGKEREQIFSVIGHDLRSPFNGILNLSQMLYDDVMNMSCAETKAMTANILSSSTQVYQIIDELMQWTQQRLGHTISEPKRCEVYTEVAQTKRLLKYALELKQLNCVVNIDPDTSVLADSAILKTILRNLISNAIKYSSAGSDITIDATTKDEDVIVSVEDTGVGISSELIEQLFSGSVQSQKDTQGTTGTGIGLSLCAELIATQHGKIWVDPSYDKGARIQFSLPLFKPV